MIPKQPDAFLGECSHEDKRSVNIRLALLLVIKNCAFMDELLIVTDNKANDKVGLC